MTLEQATRIIKNLIFSSIDKQDYTLKYRIWNIRLDDIRCEDSIKYVVDRFYDEILKLDSIDEKA